MADADTTRDHGRLIDLRGRRFDRLLVLDRAGHQGRFVTWHVRCDCGTEKIVNGGNLRAGRLRSCGCLLREIAATVNTTHGLRQSAEYSVWAKMRDRCRNSSLMEYPNYGGRGITVCERWQSFADFYADMGPRPTPQHSIDRIDVNGNYEPSNCRWATRSQQRRNCRDTIYLVFNGQRLPMADIADIIGVTYSTMENRVRRGETGERLFGPTRTRAGRI